MNAHLPSPDRPLTVSELNATVDELLQEAMPTVWVEGELSTDWRPFAQSGHVYFGLTDGASSISAVMWRSHVRHLPAGVEFVKGMAVVALGQVSVYAPRGQYQIQVQRLIPKGIGAASESLRVLKEKLQAKGYFALERKRPLPKYPLRIAIVTSAGGAVIHDCLTVIAKNWPGHDIVIEPVRVQGASAGVEIATAVRRLSDLHDSGRLVIDAVIVGRGGGSNEDLAAFDSEVVAEAIFHCPVPVVSAVGHQVNFSVADLVADVRAATPTEAAEMLTSTWSQAARVVQGLGDRLPTVLSHRLVRARERVASLAQRRPITRPLDALRDRQQRVDEASRRLSGEISRQLCRDRDRVTAFAARLEALSPLGVLARGYSLTLGPGDTVIRDAGDLSVGDTLTTRLARGRVRSMVTDLGNDDVRTP